MRKGTLADFFAASPLAGSDLKIERVRGGFREVDLNAPSKENGGPDEDRRIGPGGNFPHRRRS